MVEVRGGRRHYDFTVTAQLDLRELTGSMTDRFIHVDKFAVEVVSGTYTVQLTFAGTDVTGKQYGHTWDQLSADPAEPHEMNIVSFTFNDIIRAVVTATVAGSCRLWFSYEEYVLQEVKSGRIPDKYKIATRYGWSRLITRAEDATLGISTALRAGD